MISATRPLGQGFESGINYQAPHPTRLVAAKAYRDFLATSIAMARPKTKTKSEDLERIRQNQRRSRARRHEHIRNLESTVREYESALAASESAHQTVLHGLRSENDSLKWSLDALGASYRFSGGPVDNGVDIQNVLFPSALSHTLTSPPYMSPNYMAGSFLHDPSVEGLLDVSLVDPLPRPALNGLEDCQNAHVSTERCDDVPETTTLCSLAYRLVTQCNRQGVDMHAIHVRMQHGFQQGRSPGEGCRVDNQVLLATLTEIS